MSPLHVFLVVAAALGTVFGGVALLLFVASRGTEGRDRELIILAVKALLVGVLETIGSTVIQALKLISPPWGSPAEILPPQQSSIEPAAAPLPPVEQPASNEQPPPSGST
ncbi:hypothetical protein ACQPYE_08345 [Actinosynnema sp. CA-299493]